MLLFNSSDVSAALAASTAGTAAATATAAAAPLTGWEWWGERLLSESHGGAAKLYLWGIQYDLCTCRTADYRVLLNGRHERCVSSWLPWLRCPYHLERCQCTTPTSQA